MIVLLKIKMYYYDRKVKLIHKSNIKNCFHEKSDLESL